MQWHNIINFDNEIIFVKYNNNNNSNNIILGYLIVYNMYMDLYLTLLI